MLVSIKQFFSSHLEIGAKDAALSQQEMIHLATAALLIEVTKADFELSKLESDKVVETLRSTFKLDAMTLDALLKLAEEEVHQASSLYQFTRLINDYYEYEQKLRLIESMWEVAFADGDLDKYEEHLIRKVAELIYVAHKDFIRLKLAASCTHTATN